MNWDEVTKELQAPLSPDAIKPPPKGKFGEYVDALHVIREANRIFGHDGWSYSVTRLEMTNRAVIEAQRGPQLRVGYLCSVRVEVDGTYREGVSAGSGMGNPDSEADHHDSAIKEAETDALKRALRTFGNTFGLALYEKDKAAREVGYVVPQEALDAIEGALDLASLQAVWTANKEWQSAPDFLTAKDKRKSELTQKEAA